MRIIIFCALMVFGIWAGGYSVEYFYGPDHEFLVILGSVVGWGAGTIVGLFFLMVMAAIDHQTPDDGYPIA